MSSSFVNFEISTGLVTSDNYHVSLKGFVETTEENEATIPAVINACRDMIGKMPLMDALKLIKAEVSTQLLEPINNKLEKKITKIEISTVDALEVEEKPNIDIEIDPSLEKQTKKKGVLGKLKSLFGN